MGIGRGKAVLIGKLGISIKKEGGYVDKILATNPSDILRSSVDAKLNEDVFKNNNIDTTCLDNPTVDSVKNFVSKVSKNFIKNHLDDALLAKDVILKKAAESSSSTKEWREFLVKSGIKDYIAILDEQRKLYARKFGIPYPARKSKKKNVVQLVDNYAVETNSMSIIKTSNPVSSHYNIIPHINGIGCTCPGFTFREHCKHVDMLVDKVINEGIDSIGKANNRKEAIKMLREAVDKVHVKSNKVLETVLGGSVPAEDYDRGKYIFRLVGNRFNYHKAIELPKNGVMVEAVLEPDNPHNPNAIAIYVKNPKVNNAVKEIARNIKGEKDRQKFLEGLKVDSVDEITKKPIKIGYLPKSVATSLAEDLRVNARRYKFFLYEGGVKVELEKRGRSSKKKTTRKTSSKPSTKKRGRPRKIA